MNGFSTVDRFCHMGRLKNGSVPHHQDGGVGEIMNQNDDSNELRNHSGAGVRSELRNLETGIRNGWNIPAEILTAVP